MSNDEKKSLIHPKFAAMVSKKSRLAATLPNIQGDEPLQMIIERALATRGFSRANMNGDDFSKAVNPVQLDMESSNWNKAAQMEDNYDYAALEHRMLVHGITAESQQDLCVRLSAVFGGKVTHVEQGIHDGIIVTLETSPIDFIPLNIVLVDPPAPRPHDPEEKTMLIMHMPPINGDSGEYIFAVAWGAERARFVQEKIDLVKSLRSSGIHKAVFKLEWEHHAYLIEDEDCWAFPLVWPKAWDRDSSMLDIRDCLEAGDLLAGLANPQSFRSYIESLKDDELFKDHGEDRSDTRSFSLVVAVDEKENVDVWFEDWVEDFDQEEEYATVSISPKTWQGVCDATATLDHLWS